MSPRRIRRFAAWIALAVLAGTLLPPFINANRFRNRLADTMSRSLGREVRMGDVHFRLLPQPGFVISNLVIADDPAFSTEPMLRAESVVASLRLTSLWRGRMEISGLSLEYPSLNLAQNAEGRWNVVSVLRQASQVPAAPTAKPRAEERPRFPYIEATDGRINFRVGQEKRPHALMEADFALWLEAEDQWKMRLEARPTRTDAHLRDTGLLKVQGWLRRAETLPATEMQFDIEVEKAQLGQWTTLLTGSDHGWRGDTEMQARLEGRVSEFDYRARLRVRDFHRHDIANPDSLDGTIDCTGKVTAGIETSKANALVSCSSPVGAGALTIAGEVTPRRDPGYDLKVTARDLPMGAFANLYRRVKRSVPRDLTAQGRFNGEYRFTRQPGAKAVAWGSGRVNDLIVQSKGLGTSLPFSNFEVRFDRPRPTHLGDDLIIGSTGLRLGGTVPVYLAARITRAEILVEGKGDTELGNLVAAASTFGLADPRYQLSGLATVNLQLSGAFAGFAPPLITGSAQLRQVTTQVDGVGAPLLVQAANLQLSRESIDVVKLVARLEGTRTVVEGSVRVPRGCTAPDCSSTFDLRTADLSVDDLNRALNPRYRSTDWLSVPLRMFEGRAVKASRLMNLRAQGRIAIGRLMIKELMATNATSLLTFDRGRISLTGLQANVFSGKHTGDWTADLTGMEPEFKGKGHVDNLPVNQLSSLIRSSAGNGIARLSYDLTLRGSDATTLRTSAAGSGEFRWTNGSWRAQPGSSPVQFTQWSGRFELKGGEVALVPSEMQSRSGPYQVSGSIGFDRSLKLRLIGHRDQILVSGTSSNPRLEVVPAQPLPTGDSASNLKNATSEKVRN